MQKTSSNPALRYSLCAVIIISAAILFYLFWFRILGGIYYLESLREIEKGHYGVAIEKLKKAGEYLGNEYFIERELGDVYYRVSSLKKTMAEAVTPLIKSKECLSLAGKLNPLDAETAYLSARTGARLDILENTGRKGREQKKDAVKKLYLDAINLRPNSVTFRYGYVKYLADTREHEELAVQCRELAKIYPGSYSYLRKESFWNEDIIKATEAGLLEAVNGDYSIKDALRTLAALYSASSKWDDAVTYLERSLNYSKFENKSSDLIRLGYLYLKKNNSDKAADYFLKGLKESRNRNSHFKTVYNYYRQSDNPAGIRDVYEAGAAIFRENPEMNITYAKALTDTGEYKKAKDLLIDLNKNESNAEAYYLLAKIAEKEKDWDSMELLIQRATVLEPENSLYHYTFSGVLRRLRKFDMAESEATMAIRYLKNPNPWWYYQRAVVRMALKNYQGAAGDWKSAISLSPDRASFYSGAGNAYEKMELYPVAADYYKKAAALEPENMRYRKKYEELSKR